MPQLQLLRLKLSSLKPLQAQNTQEEALYRVRIVETRTYPRLMLMKILAPSTKSNALLIGVHRIFHSFPSPKLLIQTTGWPSPTIETVHNLFVKPCR